MCFPLFELVMDPSEFTPELTRELGSRHNAEASGSLVNVKPNRDGLILSP